MLAAVTEPASYDEHVVQLLRLGSSKAAVKGIMMSQDIIKMADGAPEMTNKLGRNIIEEGNFAKLGNIQEKRGAHMSSTRMEGILQFKNNGTDEWLESLTETRRGAVTKRCTSTKSSCDAMAKEHTSRREMDRQNAVEQEEEMRTGARLKRERDELLGLYKQKESVWMTPGEVDVALSKLEGTKDKKEAIKTQLRFYSAWSKQVDLTESSLVTPLVLKPKSDAL